MGCLCIFYVCVHMSVYMCMRERIKRVDSMNDFSLCCIPSSLLFLVTLVSFSLSINFIPILYPYIHDRVDLIPGYTGLNNQNTLYVDLVEIGIFLMCFFTNKIKGDFYWRFWKREPHSFFTKCQPNRTIATGDTEFIL